MPVRLETEASTQGSTPLERSDGAHVREADRSDAEADTTGRVERTPKVHNSRTQLTLRNALTREPLSNVRIRISWDAPHLTPEARSDLSPLSEVVTDSLGRASVSDLFPRQAYRFVVEIDGYFDTTLTRTLDEAHGPVTIDLEPFASLRVFAEHPDGTPASQTPVFVASDAGRATKLTDEHGTCTFENLRPGDYQVTAPVIGGHAQTPRSITVRRGMREELRLPVDRLITIVIHAVGLPQPSVTSSPMSMRDESATQARGDDWILLDAFLAPRVATSSADGTWRFDHVAKGTYTLGVESGSNRWTSRLVVAASRAEEHYTVTFAKQQPTTSIDGMPPTTRQR
ncbi:MAG: carboxypeptidase regulatory-like domain-containing protein [Planctomycetes bacterium]|nr:carboxypeptidase regulatory-like domain-containing protein [Planctomycetota bacterium]